jgi:hypothetical protein
MTTGALIFAFNNEETDYIGMAAWSAKNIKRHLGIPVAVVTDNVDRADKLGFDHVVLATPDAGGTRYFEDYAKTVTWYNASRIDAYSLTPWDQTLVLDADYVVASSQLLCVLESGKDFLCHRYAFDLAKAQPTDRLNVFGRYDMPMWWATVMMFRRSNTAQYIFDCMQMIRNNWQHYRDLFGITQTNYRNDFALSIALGIVSGHTWTVDEIPWTLASVMPEHELTQESQDSYRIKYLDQQQKTKYISIAGLDFHAMGKRHLGEIVETNLRSRVLDPGSSLQ